VPFLKLPGARAEIRASLLANREHDYSVTTVVANDAICPVEFSKAADLAGGTKSTFTVGNPYMYPTYVHSYWDKTVEWVRYRFIDDKGGIETDNYRSYCRCFAWTLSGSPEQGFDITELR